jgi:hypothetical protein
MLFRRLDKHRAKSWVTNSAFNTLIYGSGRGTQTTANSHGTTIHAVSGFPSTCDGLSIGCPILRLGDGSQPTFGTRFENGTLDCNGLSGCIWLDEETFPPRSKEIWSALFQPCIGNSPAFEDVPLVIAVAENTKSEVLRAKAIVALKLHLVDCSGVLMPDGERWLNSAANRPTCSLVSSSSRSSDRFDRFSISAP